MAEGFKSPSSVDCDCENLGTQTALVAVKLVTGLLYVNLEGCSKICQLEITMACGTFKAVICLVKDVVKEGGVVLMGGGEDLIALFA